MFCLDMLGIEGTTGDLFFRWNGETKVNSSGKLKVLLESADVGMRVELSGWYSSLLWQVREMAVPWKLQSEKLDVGSWSRLSIADVVKTPFGRLGGHTIPSCLYLWQMDFANSFEILSVLK